MTQVQKTIGELKAYRALLDRALASLRALDVNHARVPENGTRTPPARPQKTNGTPVSRKPATKPAPHQPPVTGGRAHAVAAILKRQGMPMSPREIRVAGDLTSSQVGYGLKVLADQKLVKAEGTTNTRRYALTPKFDVVWSGTKERAGEVPSLLGDRGSKGAAS